MKNLTLIFCTLFVYSSYSSDFISKDSDTITELEAIELGMTEVKDVSLLDNIMHGQLKQIDEDHVKNYLNNVYSYVNLAKVVVVVDKGVRTESHSAGQTVNVFHNGELVKQYQASTGTEKEKVVRNKWGKVKKRYVATTPYGFYRPKRAYKSYTSKLFTGANMDFAVFFKGGIALHSTGEKYYKYLGKRASGGCVRLKREEAKELNYLIVSQGEPNYNTKDATIKSGRKKLKREMYINRDIFADVEADSGSFTEDDIWTYDVIVLVKNGGLK